MIVKEANAAAVRWAFLSLAFICSTFIDGRQDINNGAVCTHVG